MSVKPLLVRGVNLVAVLLALDGIIYAAAILLTPFQRADLYAGAPVVYLAAALLVAALLLLLGLAMLLVAMIRKHPYRRRLAASYLVSAMVFALGLALGHGWIAFRLW